MYISLTKPSNIRRLSIVFHCVLHYKCIILCIILCIICCAAYVSSLAKGSTIVFHCAQCTTVSIHNWIKKIGNLVFSFFSPSSEMLCGLIHTKRHFFRIQPVLSTSVIPVTRVNQDHLYSVIQSSLDRIEPGNTFACINMQYYAICRSVPGSYGSHFCICIVSLVHWCTAQLVFI